MTGAEQARARGDKNTPLLNPTLDEMWQRAWRAEAALREAREAAGRVVVQLSGLAAGMDGKPEVRGLRALLIEMRDDLDAVLARAGEQT